MNPNTLNVTVVSEDADLLREVSWCLTAYGYQVQTCRQFEALATTWPATPPDFLIIDHEHSEFAAVARLPHTGNDSFTFKILLCDMHESLERIAELEYSFNDAVSKPLNLGELLARLRAGTEFLQFEQSLRQQSLCDPYTGLLSRSGLLQTLQTSSATSSNVSESVGLVLMSLDFLDNVTKLFGTDTRDHIVSEVAGIIEESVGEKAWTARIRPNTFAMAFLNSSIEEAEKLAEEIRDKVATREFKLRGDAFHLTATLCVNTLEWSDIDLGKSLAEAERNLQFAETLGGSTVSRCGQFDDSYADWVAQHIQSEAVGSNLTAQDIMTPFTAILSESDLHDDYLNTIRQSNVSVVPYYDEQGNYQGIVQAGTREDTLEFNLENAVEVPIEVDEQASRDELVEHFTDHRHELLVVMCERKPLGYITNSAMAEILAPVDAEQ